MIYLDNAATTKIDQQVTKSMLPFIKAQYGNPSSKHYTLAKTAEKAVENSRKNLSKLLNCKTEELVFASGASESNNFIIKGISDRCNADGNHIITSSIEHKSVIECCKYLEDKNYKLTYLPANENGQVNPEDLKEAITKETILISIMWANNELGTLNNIKKLASIAEQNNIFFHTDATQVLGKIEIDLQEIPINFLSCSAHKIHGPKGIGATFIRLDDLGLKQEITPLIHGGEQEEGLRAGTHSVHNIVGFGKAAELANKKMKEYVPKIKKLETYLKNELKNKLSDIQFNGDQDKKIPGIVNITITGTNNEFIINNLKKEIAISTGSACSIGEPSHVLKSIGLSSKEISSSYRISLSKFNTQKEIEKFIKIFVDEINKLKF
ncbi:cysteine desulfurase NifS [Halanaerocella petrolearia]